MLQRAVVFQRFATDDLRAILAAGPALPPTQLAPAAVLHLPNAPTMPVRGLEEYAWPA